MQNDDSLYIVQSAALNSKLFELHPSNILHDEDYENL